MGVKPLNEKTVIQKDQVTEKTSKKDQITERPRYRKRKFH